MNPKVSVVMISYKDKRPYLKQAMKSILNQDGVDVDLILSTVVGDRSISLAKKLGVKNIIANKRPDMYDQINNGVLRVSGDWFSYAVGNDVALPNKLYDEVSMCIEKGKKICYSSYYNTDENLKIMSKAKFLDYDYKKHLSGDFVTDMASVKTETLLKYMPFKKKFGNCAFWDLWLRIAEGEGPEVFVYNNKSNYLYRRGKVPSRQRQKRGDKKMWDSDELDKKKMLKSHKINYKMIDYKYRYSWRRKRKV